MAVEGDSSKGADTLELEEVTFAVVLLGSKGLGVGGLAVQVAVAQLAVAVVVVEVVGEVDVCRDRVATY